MKRTPLISISGERWSKVWKRQERSSLKPTLRALILALLIRVLPIDGLQSIPGVSNERYMAAMLDELTTEDNEESFVIVLQHGGSDKKMQTIYQWLASEMTKTWRSSWMN